MIIELTGLPGSGKSTFAKKLAGSSDYVLVEIGGRFELVYLNLLFALRHPVSFVRQLVWLVRFRGDRAFWYTKFMNLFLVHNAKFMKAGGYSRAIIDQGHHQNIISLFDTAVAPEIITAYMRILPKPDLLSFVVADAETRAKRLSGRGYTAREEFKDENREAWETAREKNFEELYIGRNKLPCITETISPGEETEKIKKMSTKRAWRFVMHARMPTEKAHGLQIAKTMEALVHSGEYVSLWIPKRSEDVDRDVGEYYGLEEPLTVHRIASPQLLRYAGTFGALAYWLDALCFAVVIFFARLPDDDVYYTRSAELVFALKLRCREVYFEAHSWPNSKTAFLHFFLRSVDGIIANSNGTAAAYRKKGFQNIRVIPNGVDLSSFAGSPTKEEARKKLSLPAGKQIVMYVGAFYAWKGVPLLLSAWAKHFGTDNSKTLVLVGGDGAALKKSGGYEDYLLTENVQLVDHQPAVLIPTYLAAADTLILPNAPVSRESVEFTSPIKLFEYMASGRPIIASDLPSIREILSEETAVFCKPNDPDSIARALALLENKEFAGLLAKNAREKVRTYTWEERAMRLKELMK